MTTNLHNDLAEQQVLGILLLNNDTLHKIDVSLTGSHFLCQSYGKAFDEIKRMILNGKIADPITLKSFFDAVFENDGAKYAIDLVETVDCISMIKDYAEIIFNLGERRKLLEMEFAIQKVMEEIRLAPHDTPLEELQLKLQTAFLPDIDFTSGSPFKLLGDLLPEVIQDAETAFKSENKVVGVTTGFDDLDKAIGGLHPSDLIFIGGRPGMGKTSLGLDMAYNAASKGTQTLFFTLEMSDKQLTQRVLSRETEIAVEDIRRGHLYVKSFVKFREAQDRMQVPLWICDRQPLPFQLLKQYAIQQHRKVKSGLIVIDYLGLLDDDSPKSKSSSDNRVQEISRLSKGLKQLARQLNVPILVASQLNRAVEGRVDKRPKLSDLRDSGSIEQDADVVMFVYRGGYYEDSAKKTTAKEASTELIIAKNRHGETKTINLEFNAPLTTFTKPT